MTSLTSLLYLKGKFDLRNFSREGAQLVSNLVTGGPSSQQERGRDSCLRAVFCYKRLFTKACMGCKLFSLKERKNVVFLNKIDLPYYLVVFFVVCPRLRPF